MYVISNLLVKGLDQRQLVQEKKTMMVFDGAHHRLGELSLLATQSSYSQLRQFLRISLSSEIGPQDRTC